MRHRFLTRPLSAVLLALTLVGTLFAAATAGCHRPTAARPTPGRRPPRPPGHPGAEMPTVVLVHGAFADSSGWSDVATALMDQASRSSRSPTRCATRSATAHTCARS